MEQNFASYIRNADRIFKENGATQPTVVEVMDTMKARIVQMYGHSLMLQILWVSATLSLRQRKQSL